MFSMDDPRITVDPADMAGVAELSEELGMSRQSICNWAAGRARHDFPAPLFRLKATPVWSRAAVRQWFDGVEGATKE